MKKLLLILLTIIVITWTQTILAQDFEIIPQAETNVWSDVDAIWNAWGKVREAYNKQAESYQQWGKIWSAFASGVFTRSTILDYLVYLIRFLSQAWLLVWAAMIIYAWYIYASSSFTWWDAWKWKKAITNAIIWVLVIVFSYAIMKIVTSAFIS